MNLSLKKASPIQILDSKEIILYIYTFIFVNIILKNLLLIPIKILPFHRWILLIPCIVMHGIYMK